MHTADNDAEAQPDKGEMPQYLAKAVLFQTLEHGIDLRGNLRGGRAGNGGEGACQGAKQVVQGPSGHHRIVGQNNKGGEDADPARQLPGGAATLQAYKGTDSVAPGMSADHQFRHHDRQADQGDADQVDQHKSAATVVAGDVGKLPDVAETHGAAGGRQDKAEA